MPRKLSKELTRKEMKVPPLFGGIDASTRPIGQSAHRPQLERAGWYLRDHFEVFDDE